MYSRTVGSIASGHWGYSVGGGALGGAALGAGIGALAADDTGLGAMIGGGSGLALGAGGGAFAKAAANNIARGHGWSGSGGLKGFYGGFTKKGFGQGVAKAQPDSRLVSGYTPPHTASATMITGGGTYSPSGMVSPILRG